MSQMSRTGFPVCPPRCPGAAEIRGPNCLQPETILSARRYTPVMSTKRRILWIIVLGTLGTGAFLAPGTLGAATPPQEKKARPFSMGVNPFPYDLTPEAIEATQLWILDNTDLVTIKLDEGVPWEEALENKSSYDPAFEGSLEWRSKHPQDRRVFVSVTPLNKDKNGMAGYRGPQENMPNPDPWNKKDLDDPLVAKAYLNF